MFKLIWDDQAYDELNKLEGPIRRRIFNRIDKLSDNPFLGDIKKLKGDDSFRLRIGDYRVIFEVNGNIITILKVGHRKNVYDR